MANDNSGSVYDNKGLPMGSILAAQDNSGSVYDAKGLPFGGIGTSSTTVVQMPFNYAPWFYQ